MNTPSWWSSYSARIATGYISLGNARARWECNLGEIREVEGVYCFVISFDFMPGSSSAGTCIDDRLVPAESAWSNSENGYPALERYIGFCANGHMKHWLQGNRKGG